MARRAAACMAWPLRRHRWALVVAIVLAAVAWIRLGPLPDGLLEAPGASSVVIVDRHGETLAEPRSAWGTRSRLVTADALPRLMVAATIAAEDRRYEQHWGVDPIAIARAAVTNARLGRISEGGSTITQQVIKLLRARRGGGRPPVGWWAKLSEAVLALRLEHRLDKEQILALYLNLAPYGNQIEGASRAAAAYLGRDLDELTAAEAAFLAALPQRPSRFNPWRDPAAARERQLRVLSTMAESGAIDSSTLSLARDERIAFRREVPDAIAPHFVERVRDEVAAGDAARRADAAGVALGPRRIETTLDASLERVVRGIIRANRPALEAHHAANVAVAVLDNATGEWLAWEGSGDYFDAAHGGAIDGVVSPRQPGSALKPFTYAAAFERDMHPGSVLADIPTQFPTAEPGVMYSPRNYDDQFRGPLRARVALAGSENVPAVALAAEIGVPAVGRLLRASGLTTLERNGDYYGLGLTLGNAEVRLDELVAAYAMFARGGVWRPTRRIKSGHATGIGPGFALEADRRVVSERAAFWIADILADNEARAYIFGRGGSLEFPFPVAVKSGTSQEFHDNWVVGFTRDVTVGVWVGNFDRTPLRGSSGVTGAGPIFHDVMLAAVERARGSLPIGNAQPIVAPTGDVHPVELCAVSGMAPGATCPRRVTEWLPADAAPEICDWHDAGLPGQTLWPEHYLHWARSQGEEPMSQRAPSRETERPDARRAVESRALRIVDPLAGAVFLIDPTLRREFQSLPLRAAGAAAGALRWFVDGELFAEAPSDEPVRWPLALGPHDIRVQDSSGAAADTRVVVR